MVGLFVGVSGLVFFVASVSDCANDFLMVPVDGGPIDGLSKRLMIGSVDFDISPGELTPYSPGWCPDGCPA